MPFEGRKLRSSGSAKGAHPPVMSKRERVEELDNGEHHSDENMPIIPVTKRVKGQGVERAQGVKCHVNDINPIKQDTERVKEQVVQPSGGAEKRVSDTSPSIENATRVQESSDERVGSSESLISDTQPVLSQHPGAQVPTEIFQQIMDVSIQRTALTEDLASVAGALYRIAAISPWARQHVIKICRAFPGVTYEKIKQHPYKRWIRPVRDLVGQIYGLNFAYGFLAWLTARGKGDLAQHLATADWRMGILFQVGVTLEAQARLAAAPVHP